MIKIDSLSKSFGNNVVLKNINLSFKPGEINGIVGENGAGKTTLFRCIAGLESFDGNIEYSNGIIKNVTGFLETNPPFLSKITGLEYLQLLCNARKIKIEDLKSKNLFDLPLDRYAESYSTGMKKKLALTAVLLQKNKIFILDEPFNGVDIHSNILIHVLLNKLKSLGKTIVLSSHIFSTMSENCDYIHLLENGKITKSASKDGFHEIEKQMVKTGIGHKIDLLDLGN